MFPVLFLIGTFFLISPTVRLPLLGISISDLFIFCALLWLIGESLLRPRDPKSAMPIHILWIPASVILASGLLSSIPAISPVVSIGIVIKIWFVLTAWISMAIVIVRRGYLLPVLYVLIVAGCVTTMVALIDTFTTIHLGDRISGNTLNFYTRRLGTFGHPNDQGFFLSVVLPLAFGLLLREWETRRRLVRLFVWGAATILLGLGVFLSGSVAGWVSTVISMGIIGLFLLFKSSRLTKLGLGAAVLGLVAAVGILMTQSSFATGVNSALAFNLFRVSNITGPGRLVLLEQAFDYIDQSPWIGSGLDQTGTGQLNRNELLTGDFIHNTIISGWLNGGFFMFVGLLMVYAIAVITALRALAYGVRQKDWLIVCMGALVFGYIFFDQTQPHLAQRFSWLVLGLLFGLGFGIQSIKIRISPATKPQGEIPPQQERLYV